MLTRRWSSKAIRMRSGSLGGSIYWVLLLRGWFAVTATIIPDAGSTFLPLQHTATLTPSVDWGLRGGCDCGKLDRAIDGLPLGRTGMQGVET